MIENAVIMLRISRPKRLEQTIPVQNASFGSKRVQIGVKKRIGTDFGQLWPDLGPSGSEIVENAVIMLRLAARSVWSIQFYRKMRVLGSKGCK